MVVVVDDDDDGGEEPLEPTRVVGAIGFYGRSREVCVYRGEGKGMIDG